MGIEYEKTYRHHFFTSFMWGIIRRNVTEFNMTFRPEKFLKIYRLTHSSQNEMISSEEFLCYRTVFRGSCELLLPPRRSYSRTSKRSIRMGALRILLMIDDELRFEGFSFVLTLLINDEFVDPVRFPGFVMRKRSEKR